MWCRKPKTLARGDKAPHIRLKNLDGSIWDLQQTLLERRVLLVFFKISCPTCQFTLPFLQRLSSNSSASIVLVSQDEAHGTREFLKHFGVDLPTVLDEGRAYAASNAFQITHVPSVFLIEQDGTISSAGSGFQKSELEGFSTQFGVPIFWPGEQVPMMRPG